MCNSNKHTSLSHGGIECYSNFLYNTRKVHTKPLIMGGLNYKEMLIYQVIFLLLRTPILILIVRSFASSNPGTRSDLPVYFALIGG